MTNNRTKNNLTAHKSRNAGFSLVELLVTVAILGVALGFTAISYTVVSRSNVKKAASYADDALALCRQRSMVSSGQWCVVIKSDGVSVVKRTGADGSYTDESISDSGIPKSVDVFVGQNKSTGLKQLGVDCDSVTIYFNTLNGDIKNVTMQTSGSAETDIKDDTSGSCYLVFRYKDKKECRVKIYYSTGKHTVETD